MPLKDHKIKLLKQLKDLLTKETPSLLFSVNFKVTNNKVKD